MKVLVAYATRHGATAGIATRIAETLGATGHEAVAIPVDQVSELGGFDAVIVGAAAYAFDWLKPAVRFVERHRDELAARPLWLFSSGPLGTEQVDEKGQDVLRTTRPQEFDELTALVHPRGERVFFGAYDPDAAPVGLAERAMRLMPAARSALPAGDFRDWDAIDTWAREIAAALDRP